MDWRRWPNEAFATVGWNTAYVGSVPTFRDSLSVPSSRVKQSKKNFSWTAGHLKMGPLGCPETSVNNYQPKLRNIVEERKPQLQCGESLKSRNLITWPPRLFELRPLPFFLWGRRKNALYVLLLSATLPKLAGRIWAATATVKCTMVPSVWTEPEWGCDTCGYWHCPHYESVNCWVWVSRKIWFCNPPVSLISWAILH